MWREGEAERYKTLRRALASLSHSPHPIGRLDLSILYNDHDDPILYFLLILDLPYTLIDLIESCYVRITDPQRTPGRGAFFAVLLTALPLTRCVTI